MARITVIGGTGYTGSAVARAASGRGHDVTAYSRRPVSSPQEGVRYEAASLLDPEVRERVVGFADVVVSSLSPRGDMQGQLVAVNAHLADLAASRGTRLGVVGGFSSMRVAPGGPRLASTGQLPPEYEAEGKEMAAVVEALSAAAAGADWFYVSPSPQYGAHVAAAARGTYTLGGDVVPTDLDFGATLPVDDFAAAILDEIERPAHRGQHFFVC